jgi:hypothetical protein
MWDRPSLKTPVILASLTVVALVGAGQLDPSDWKAIILGGLAIVFLLGAIASAINWLLYEWTERDAEMRRKNTITPRLMELQAAARLTPEQVKVVPQITYNTEIGLIPGADDEPQYVLITAGGTIPLDWIYDYLMDCGVTYLRQINTYADKTPGRLFAQLFTDWCIRQGLAVPATGPHAAAWVNEHAKRRCARMLNISLDE